MTTNQDFKDIKRPPKAQIEALKKIGAATVAGTLGHMGIRNPHIQGPVSWHKGRVMVGPALTLQFMPKREDLYGEGEYADPEKQLHRHVLYKTQPGDVVVVDARGDMTAGIFGEMMMTYFKGRGGAGLVIDGCIRDYPGQIELDMPMWIRGLTPNFHTQTGLMPMDYNIPIACGGVTVIPGDIIVADDDGAVVIPHDLVEFVTHEGAEHELMESWLVQEVEKGEKLPGLYPPNEANKARYEAWKKSR